MLGAFLFRAILKYLFTYLAAPDLGVACGIFSCGIQDLVPLPGIKPRSPALGVQNPSHWTSREVPFQAFIKETHTIKKYFERCKRKAYAHNHEAVHVDKHLHSSNFLWFLTLTFILSTQPLQEHVLSHFFPRTSHRLSLRGFVITSTCTPRKVLLSSMFHLAPGVCNQNHIQQVSQTSRVPQAKH